MLLALQVVLEHLHLLLIPAMPVTLEHCQLQRRITRNTATRPQTPQTNAHTTPYFSCGVSGLGASCVRRILAGRALTSWLYLREGAGEDDG